MPPQVSVIIPTYNRAGSISRSLKSILNQTFQDFEIIVVDDGSTDDTHQVTADLADARIRLLRHETNLGPGPARNTGMQAATGHYIAWLDSDDEWFPEKLETQLTAMRQAAPQFKASYTAYEIVQQDFAKVYFSPYSDQRKLFLGSDKAPGSTLLFERTLLTEIGLLDTSMRRFEDWDWLLRYSRNYELLPVDRPLSRIYYSPRRSAAAVEQSTLAFVAKYSQDLRRFGLFRNVVISKRWMEVASYYAQEPNFSKMFHYIFKAFSVYPFPPMNVWGWLVKDLLGIKLSSKFMKR